MEKIKVRGVESERGGALSRPSLSGNVLITGGSGFIGRAIIARAHDEGWNARFTVLSRDEQKQALVMTRWPDVRCVLGDIRDNERLQDIMFGHDVIIHTGALKYIPEAEFNVDECIGVNLLGSRNVLRLAQGVVDRVVALSTDKAVSPLNVYGATKMLMERLFVEADLCSPMTRYTVVRYGNVIGSTGSIIPVMTKLMKANKTLPITDPGMTRFWITPDEAIDLICVAATCDDRGVTIIPRGRACAVSTVVEAIAEVVGPPFSTYTEDIIGVRPGEKLFEALVNQHESIRCIWNDPYYFLMPQGRSGDGEPFEFTSDSADPISVAELAEAIKLAEAI